MSRPDAARSHLYTHAAPSGGHGGTAVEVASFRPDDRSALVSASLSCPLCLSGDVAWALDLEPWDPSARCTCRRCGHERDVWLSPDQALRLSVAALTR